jgi:hypothetical protein
VSVVRSPPLDDLQSDVCAALGAAGADIGGFSRAAVWTPHLTLLDRGLTPERLGRAVEILARRPHPSWTVAVESLVVGRRGGRRSPPLVLGERR